jgi:hypothetical protein
MNLIPTALHIGDAGSSDFDVLAFHRLRVVAEAAKPRACVFGRVSRCVTLSTHIGSTRKCPCWLDLFFAFSIDRNGGLNLT